MKELITEKGAAHLERWLGAHQDDAFLVHPERWLRLGYQHLRPWQHLLQQLPQRLSNDDVLKVRGEGSPMKLFFWALAWGFGGTRQGYGAWRTDQMVQASDAPQRVDRLFGIVAKGNVLQAFASLHDADRCRLPRLGTAFGTKLLYFAGFGLTAAPFEPLVLDAMVIRALAMPDLLTSAGSQAFEGIQATTSDPVTYGRYLRGVHDIRDKHAPDTRVDFIERWLWSLGARKAVL